MQSDLRWDLGHEVIRVRRDHDYGYVQRRGGHHDPTQNWSLSIDSGFHRELGVETQPKGMEVGVQCPTCSETLNVQGRDWTTDSESELDLGGDSDSESHEVSARMR